MASEQLLILKEKLHEMEKGMLTMAWDYRQDQLHPFKKQQFEGMLKEKEVLVKEINQLENPEDSE